VRCNEHQQLLNQYLVAVARSNEAASVMAARNPWSVTWREIMREMVAACRKAIAEFDDHRQQHGC
jgi:hypothetical protein